MKKQVFLLICTAILLCGNGCTATQVRDRAYLQAMELRSPQMPAVQLHDFHTKKTSVSGDGATLADAITNAAVPAGKDLFLGHLELIAYQDPTYGAQLDQLMSDYRLSPACKVVGLPDNTTLTDTDTSELTRQLRLAETNGMLPETDLFTILREWDNTSGTALLPLVTADGFSAAVVTKEKIVTALSEDAIAGLCWLRGDNYPGQITTSDGETFHVTSAKTQLSAEEKRGYVQITATITLHGNGNSGSAADEIERVCRAAIQETVTEHHADIIGLEACLWSQCYDFMAEQDWNSAADLLDFEVFVK